MVESFEGEKRQINELNQVLLSCTTKHDFPGSPSIHFLASLLARICGSGGTQELAKSLREL